MHKRFYVVTTVAANPILAPPRLFIGLKQHASFSPSLKRAPDHTPATACDPEQMFLLCIKAMLSHLKLYLVHCFWQQPKNKWHHWSAFRQTKKKCSVIITQNLQCHRSLFFPSLLLPSFSLFGTPPSVILGKLRGTFPWFIYVFGYWAVLDGEEVSECVDRL